MPKFRKLPVEVEAFCLEIGAMPPDWFQKALVAGTVRPVPAPATGCDNWGGEGADIHTMEGIMRADIGDWVIQGVRGEIYPCKPDIFATTYEQAYPAWASGISSPKSDSA